MFYQGGDTALIRASANGHVAIVRVLLKRGASIDIRNHVRIFYQHKIRARIYKNFIQL